MGRRTKQAPTVAPEIARKVLGYVRGSTDEQELTIEAQANRIRAYCVTHELDLIDIVPDEGVSGGVAPDQRPGLARALERVRAGEAGGLVILRLDRMTRSVRDLLALVDDMRARGWALHSVTEQLDTSSPMGEFCLTILGAVAQLERKLIKQRTRDALQVLKDRGAHIGSAPYGKRRVAGAGGKLTALVDEPGELKVVERMRRMQRDRTPHHVIAERLNADGVSTRSGKPWHRRTVQDILSRREVTA